MKLIVKPESSNLWWGIYGLTDKIGWEDLNIFNENDEKIGCLFKYKRIFAFKP